MRRETGFTLIEVMVALAVAAIALTALAQGMGRMLEHQAALQTRAEAGWLANAALVTLAQTPVGPAGLEKQVEYGGQTWTVRYVRRATPVAGLYQVEIRVIPPGAEAPAAVRTTVVVH